MAILSKEELVELTGGLKQGAAQIRWIERALGIKAPRRIDGTPMITWEQINNVLQPAQPQSTHAKINWTKPLQHSML
ncbi:hypothetical protein C6T58_24840 [Burkholderia multivorans]|uniref:DUF4224 domain-containing protein n=1 Tax=Burkholderia multivorans TaxID=87883 RepID=UPI000CFFA370|nr:DUF4224 domain-containing protein [Burkholderia multivorans]PRG76148.1 hypothetical protein C6T58_24840 [Burkholderia multivorans]